MLARLLQRRKGQADQVWPLDPDQATTIGRLGSAPQAVDVVLGADRFVSRRHARIWHADNGWWIQDLDSRHGTLVGGRDIRGHGPTSLTSGDDIVIGGTRLVFAAVGLPTLHAGPFTVEIAMSPAVNFSLMHCGLPIVEQIVVRASTEPTPPAALSLALVPYAEAHDLSVPALAPGASVSFSRPAFSLDYAALHAQTERARWPLQIRIDGRPVEGEAVETWVLAHNEWSAADEHRLSLAAFVVPNHPLIGQIVAEVAPEAVDPEYVLTELHQYFAARWRLGYRLEPPNWTSNSQKIRLPHQVLVDPVERVGLGTCIDLALVYAAALEHVGLQPLLAIVDMGDWWHALVGVWRVPATGLEPLLFDQRRLLDEGVWLDPTGCTRDPTVRRDVAAARTEAVRVLTDRPMRFALDVAAARQDHITPLPFAGEPQASAAVRAALEWARSVAAGAGLGGAAVLIGLLQVEGGLARQVIAARLGSVDATVRRLTAGLRPSPGGGSVHRALDLARSMARDDGSPMILEPHLLTAVLQTPSASLDAALETLGTTRADLLAAARPRGPVRGQQQYSVFSEWRSA